MEIVKKSWDLYGKDFNSLDFEEQKDIFRRLAEFLCIKKLGCSRMPTIVYVDLEDALLGSYSHDENLIRIDSANFRDSNYSLEEKINTLAHECYHACQHSMVDSMYSIRKTYFDLYQNIRIQRNFRDIFAWEEDMQNYQEKKDFGVYYTSDIETDARDYATEVNEELSEAWTAYFSQLDEGEIREKAKNAEFFHMYTPEDDLELLGITAVLSFVIGLIMYWRTKNRYLSLSVVLGFMSLTCYTSIVQESHAFALNYGIEVHSFLYKNNLQILICFFCLM